MSAPTAIEGALALLYRRAGVPRPHEQVPGRDPPIVPLDALLCEQPILCDELPRLTRGRAMEYLRRRTGADLPLLPHPDEPLAGFLYAFPYEGEVWACLLVQQGDIIERRRFSAAHELGHYLLHFLPLLQRELQRGQHLFLSEGFSFTESLDVDEALPGAAGLCAQDIRGTALDALQAGLPRLEAEANRFAAELLMPESVCRALWERPRGLRTSRRLAQELLVSPAAMRVRLNTLGYVS